MQKKIFEKINNKQNQNITNESIIKSVIANFLEKYHEEMVKPEALENRISGVCSDIVNTYVSKRLKNNEMGYDSPFIFLEKTKTKQETEVVGLEKVFTTSHNKVIIEGNAIKEKYKKNIGLLFIKLKKNF